MDLIHWLNMCISPPTHHHHHQQWQLLNNSRISLNLWNSWKWVAASCLCADYFNPLREGVCVESRYKKLIPLGESICSALIDMTELYVYALLRRLGSCYNVAGTTMVHSKWQLSMTNNSSNLIFKLWAQIQKHCYNQQWNFCEAICAIYVYMKVLFRVLF